MDSRVLPDNSLTLPETIDFHIKHNPSNPLYVFSEDSKYESDVTNITYLEFGRATDRVAHYVRPSRAGADGQVVAFIALSDTLLFHAVTIGIMRAGLVPYPMSPRNTAAAIVKMMRDVSSHRLLTTQQTLRPLLGEIQMELSKEATPYNISFEEVPPLSEIFPKLGNETAADPFEPYPKAPRPPLDNTALYLHSSGSTGLPKTIRHTFKSLSHWAGFALISEFRDFWPKLTVASMVLPPFHTLAVGIHLLVGLYAVVPNGLYPPIATTPGSLPMVPTPGNILDHIARTKSNCLVILPALLQMWAEDQNALKTLASLEFVAYSGGGLPSALGDSLVDSGIYLVSIFGGTEFGPVAHIFRRKGEERSWQYVEFSERVSVRWDPQGDGTYEAQYLTTETHQPSVENIDDVKGYASSDLWVCHPTKSHAWKIVGRKDDVIIHTSGEKTVPAPMENVLMSSPYIRSAIIFGRDHDQTGVLVELKPEMAIDPDNEKALIAVRNALWPVVEEANKVGPAFSRIFKEMILITSPNKPLPRAGKGTVMRKAALSAYHDEIEEIYNRVLATTRVDAVVPPRSWDKNDTVAWLKEQVEDIHSAKHFSTADDLFSQGMDSLGATILRRRIIGALQSKDSKQVAALVTQTTIYTYPTIEKLAGFISGSISNPGNHVSTSSSTDAMDLMIKKYSSGLDDPISTGAPPAGGAVVLLTGSTGNLGAQLLESLLRDPHVRTVFTLDRPSSSKPVQSRQAERFTDKGFDVSLLHSSRLVPLEGDASQTNFGLTEAVYDKLRTSVTIIIHNAWRLDFNLSLSSFEPNVRGTRNLIDLARSSPHASSVRFLFTSSIASTNSWDSSLGPYPEEVVMDPRYAVGNGYGEGKYVSERILTQSGLQATSFRIGQITGGNPNGSWATTDWVPIIVKSSLRLGALPSAVGLASYLPMHAVSQTLLDIAFSANSPPPALNIVHPRPVSWNYIMSSISQALVREGVISAKLPFNDFQSWFFHLEARSADASEKDFQELPALKLLEFFRHMMQADIDMQKQGVNQAETGGLTNLSTEKVQTLSSTMKNLPLLDESDAQKWVQYWKGVGFFNGSATQERLRPLQ
ncbi:acetyl-CoA synthetase-like protein [Gymnopilus junonius]|uniref:Acetyl-CoA synthetase-like protein n=1 Tax=Gymnopilus junonius TaxID=109634 RepID=A0A9P5NND9_GYMJU|nr:acetyl-CoA synthetase-like protein [Gymnopilus junonius]